MLRHISNAVAISDSVHLSRIHTPLSVFVMEKFVRDISGHGTLFCMGLATDCGFISDAVK